jgi:peptide/nickel transport system permease protein
VLNFIARRLLMSIPVVIGVSVLLFALLFLVPGDPTVFILG